MTASPEKTTLAALICLALCAGGPGELRAQIPEEDIWAVDQERALGQLTIYNSEPGGGFIGIPLELGDFNSDGRMDFVVTAMFADTGPANDRKNGGEVYLYQGDGRLQGELDRASLPAATGTLTLEGERGGDFLGTEVFTADVNGDGIDDLLIGAQNLDLVSGNTLLRDNCGGVYVVLGRQGIFQGNSTLDLSTANPGIIRILGAETGERAGVWVESGDLDGD
ncbi:MAG: VCBS repeat-containing protein, partial [Planctomycetota bacterium]|nr:VCBS repeat-containing protein [Planctomycetota bacterium]